MDVVKVVKIAGSRAVIELSKITNNPNILKKLYIHISDTYQLRSEHLPGSRK